MQQHLLSKNLPSVEITEIRNLAQVNGCLEINDDDLVQLESQPLSGRQVVIRMEGCVLVHYRTNLRIRVRPALLENLVGYLSFGPTASGKINGLQVRNDILLAVSPGASVELVADAGYESIGLLMRSDSTFSQWASPRAVEMLHDGAGLARRLFETGKRLVDAAVAQPALFNDSAEQRRSAQQELVETLLATLTCAQKFTPERSERALQVQSQIVRAAEKYALARADERIYVADLCKAAAVSERTLDYAFQAVMGLSPRVYLARVRLHKVRQALLQASPGKTSVTTEALNWGFWHFGDFSKSYKKCFDELPSHTLRKSLDSKFKRVGQAAD